MVTKVISGDRSHGGFVDLNKNELRNARVQNLGAAPSSPVTGQLYYDTGTNILYYWNGTAWTSSSGAILATIVDAKGDLIVGTAADTVARQAVGADGTLLVAASGQATGVQWRTITEADIQIGATDRLVGRDTAGAGAAEELTVGGGIEFTGSGGIQTSALTGDVTKTAGGTATTIAADVVTNTQLANMAQATFKMRAAAAGTGDPIDGTVAQAKTALAYLASEVTFTPAGTIAATDVQAAIVEAYNDATAYTDSVAQGLAPKDSVRVATTAAGTLATSFENADVIDGVTLATGDRILIKDQAAGAENGIYVVNASGAPTRATDADSSNDLRGATVWVEEGTVNADTGWVLTTNAPITVGTTALSFTQNSGLGQITAGAALTKTGNTLDVAVSTGIEVSSDALRISAAAAGAGLTGGAGSALAVGQGTGITVNADDVAVDTAVVVRKYAATLAGGANSEVITHNLGTRDVVVICYDNSAPYAEIEYTVEHTTTNTITVYNAAGVNLPAGHRIVVHG